MTDLAGWMWGTLYQDDILNRLAIGRFLREMLDVLHPAVHNLQTPSSKWSFNFLPSTLPPRIIATDGTKEHAKMMIYSGHDSTLVPVLCALGIYDGTILGFLLNTLYYSTVYCFVNFSCSDIPIIYVSIFL